RDEKNEEDTPVLLGSPNQKGVMVAEGRSPGHISFSQEKAAVNHLFRAQLSSSAGLGSLLTENPGPLEDMQRVVQAPLPGSFSPDNELRWHVESPKARHVGYNGKGSRGGCGKFCAPTIVRFLRYAVATARRAMECGKSANRQSCSSATRALAE
ncbi:unnamed protein product, partial [Ectocarpus sp. 4 AP-2014]